jgi:methyl-accepting chemotaxis protein WspA
VKNTSIRNMIIASFAIVLAAMLAMGGIGYAGIEKIQDEAAIVERNTITDLSSAAELAIAWSQRFSLLQAILVPDARSGALAVEERLEDNRALIQRLSKIRETEHQAGAGQQQFAALQTLDETYGAAEAEILRLYRENRGEEARAAFNGRLRPVFDRHQASLSALVQSGKKAAESAAQLTAEHGTLAEIGMAASLAIAILLAVGAGIMLLRAVTVPLGRLSEAAERMREGDFSQRVELARHDEFGVLAAAFNRMTEDLTALIGQVQRSSIQVSTSITETAATSREQQATANEIAATTSEIGATSREISATSRELVRTMQEVSSVADHTAHLADAGKLGLVRMEEMMRQVVAAAGSINAKLGVLNEKAGNINQVVTTITKVADQTNLLSLNAAIEAEKAGEYGRGFGVVATEIRRLADQTAVATYDIEQMVKDIQSAISAGVMGMDKFSEEVRRGVGEIEQVGRQLSAIIEEAQGLAPRFESVNEGMQAQALGAGQISDALSQLGEAVAQTVESLQQSSQAIDELNQVATGLRGSISRFRLQA